MTSGPTIGKTVTNNPSSCADNPASHVLPWAGTWVKLAIKAVLVADADAIKSAEIQEALQKLLKAGGSHRFYRGELCTDDAVKKIIRMFVLLVNDLRWLPQPAMEPDHFADLLSGILRFWESVFGNASKYPNKQRISTRGMMRQVMYEMAIVAGFLAANSSSPKEILEGHWHSPAALSRWINSLCHQGGLSEAHVLRAANLSRSVWRRLFDNGEVPESFGFQTFAAALHPNDAAAEASLSSALKRTFAAREFARLLEKEVDVGEPSRAFWDDTWAKFVYFSAMACGRTQRNNNSVGLGRIQTEVAIIAGNLDIVSIFKIHAKATRHGDLWPLWEDYAGFADSYARTHKVENAQDLEEAVMAAIVHTWSSDESVLRRRLWHAKTSEETKYCLKALLRIAPDDIGSWSKLASIYKSEKRIAEAEAALKAATSCSLSGITERLGLANFLSETGRAEEARVIIEQAKDERDPEWVYAMGCFAFDRKETEQAIHWLNLSIKMGRHLFHCHRMLSDLYRELGDQKNTEHHVLQAARFRPRS